MKVSLYRRNNVWWLLLSLIINTSYCSHYFQVSISIVSKSKICYGDCVIPYKLVVSKEINDLKELNEEMMVFGEFEVINNTNNEGYLNEITVVRMPKSLRESKEPVHIELTILDLPSNIEEYIDVNVTSLLHEKRQLKVHSKLSSTTELYMDIVRKHEVERYTNYINNNNNECACQDGKKECSCCSHVYIPIIGLNHYSCFNATYIGESNNLILTMEIEKEVIFRKTDNIMSTTKHFKVIPVLKKHVYGDIQLSNIHMGRRVMHFCMELLIRRLQVRVVKEKIGCFNIPI